MSSDPFESLDSLMSGLSIESAPPQSLDSLMSGLSIASAPPPTASNYTAPLRMDARLTLNNFDPHGEPTLPKNRDSHLYSALPLTSPDSPSIASMLDYLQRQILADGSDPLETVLTIGRNDCWLTSSRPEKAYRFTPTIVFSASKTNSGRSNKQPQLAIRHYGSLSDADLLELNEARRRWEVVARGTFVGQGAAVQQPLTYADFIQPMFDQLIAASQKLQRDPNDPENGITFQMASGTASVFG